MVIGRKLALIIWPLTGLIFLGMGGSILYMFGFENQTVIISTLLALTLDFLFIKYKLSSWKKPDIKQIRKAQGNMQKYAKYGWFGVLGYLIAKLPFLAHNDTLGILSGAFMGILLPVMTAVLFYEALTEKGIYTKK